jgi:hypothetical protein
MSDEKIVEVLAGGLCAELTKVFQAAAKGQVQISWEELSRRTLSALRDAGYGVVPVLCDTEATDRAWAMYQERPHCFERFIAAINAYVADAAATPSQSPE